MKTHIYFISSLLASSLLMKAQTLTQSANAPIPGDLESRKGADTTGALPNSTTGNTATWNLTGANAINTNTTTFSNSWVNPSSLPGSSLFTSAGANVAHSDSTMFVKSSSTKLEYLGDMMADGSVNQFTNTIEIMHFPFSYGNSYTDNFSGYTYAAFLGGTLNVTGTLTVTADGQGTLILPTNPTPTNFSVLRIKNQINMNIAGTGTLSTVTGTVQSTNYQFFKTGTKAPILSYDYQTTNIPAFGINNQKSFSMDHDASLVLNVNQLSQNNTPYVFVYPNPTTHHLTIHSNLSNSYRIEIFNINGQQIYKDKLNSEEYTIDTQFWSNGMYIIQFTDETNKSFSSKFIKE